MKIIKIINLLYISKFAKNIIALLENILFIFL